MSKLIRIGSFPHLSAISKESMAEKIVELEKRNKELEQTIKDLEFGINGTWSKNMLLDRIKEQSK